MRRTAAFAGIVLSAVALSGGVQFHGFTQAQTAPQNPPTFRAGVDIVQLDVSVLDRNRVPVTGLTAADFTVLDEGQPRKVVVFSAVDVPAFNPPRAAWMRTAAADVTSNQLDGRRLIVIAISDRYVDRVQLGQQATETALRLADDVIDHLGAGDFASVAYIYHPQFGQDFTADPAKLRQALDRFQPISAGTALSGRGLGAHDFALAGGDGPIVPPDLEASRTRVVVRLTDLVGTLAPIPDRRKTIFFIGDGGDIHGLQDLEDLYRAAQRANVNIYTFDAAGLRPTGTGPEVLRDLAANTGGFAVNSTNAPEEDVPAILRENQSYYLLGFEPVPATDGRLRKVDVKVNRPGVEVRARRGYYPSAPEALGTGGARLTTEALFAAPLAARDLPLQIAAAPFAGSAGSMPAVAIAISIAEPGVSWSVVDTLQIEVRSFDENGQQESAVRETSRWESHPAGAGERQGLVFARMLLPPGYHELRAVVRSAQLNKSGSVFADVDVPDFAKNPLSLSGVVMHAEPAPGNLGTAPLAGLVAAVPTTQREFTRASHVSALLTIYQGARGALQPVTLATRILNDRDALVDTTSERLPIERFDNKAREAPWSHDLPIDRLAPGDYLAIFEAAMGKQVVQRDVQFRVR